MLEGEHANQFEGGGLQLDGLLAARRFDELSKGSYGASGGDVAILDHCVAICVICYHNL